MQKGKYKAMLIVCGTALAMGIISFAVTVKLYDNNYEKEIDESIKKSELAQDNSVKDEKEDLLVKNNQDEVKIQIDEIEAISDEAATTTDGYLGEEIEVMEITEDE